MIVKRVLIEQVKLNKTIEDFENLTFNVKPNIYKKKQFIYLQWPSRKVSGKNIISVDFSLHTPDIFAIDISVPYKLGNDCENVRKACNLIGANFREPSEGLEDCWCETVNMNISSFKKLPSLINKIYKLIAE
jgi:hypothetical protein